MYLSVEISMYPLHEDYKPRIKEFLHELNTDPAKFDVRSSNMSTRIFGEFEEVNTVINKAMKNSMEKYGKIVFVCKYLQGDARELSGYD